MGLLGALSIKIQIKSEGDLFHDLIRHTPHHMPNISSLVPGCDLHDGDWGNHGSIVRWKYIHDGKEKFAKDRVEVDEAKKSILYNVIEGDILEEFKSFKFSLHVDTTSETGHFVTWTLEYERLHEGIEHPVSLIPFFINVTKDIEAHHHVENKS